MKAHRYKLFLKLYQEVFKELEEVHERLYPKAYFPSNIDSVDEQEVWLSGVDTWSYGGREEHSSVIKTESFIDGKKEAYWQAHFEQEEKKRKAKEEVEEKKRLAVEAREKAKLAELLAKYPQG